MDCCYSGSSVDLGLVRKSFHRGELFFSDVVRAHCEWKEDNRYMVLGFPDDPRRDSFVDVRGRPSMTYHHYYGFLLAKRGNCVYRSRVRNSLDPLMSVVGLCKKVSFFDPDGRGGRSPLLLVTLTCNSAQSLDRYGNFDPSIAWYGVGSSVNTFLSRLKAKYGKVSVLRSFEFYDVSGLPHVHLVIYFHKVDFEGARYVDRKGNIKFLASSKVNRDISLMHHSGGSFVNIRVAYSLGAVGYISKYVTKYVFDEKSNKTIVACWLFGNRQYSVSSDFVETVSSVAERNGVQLDTLMRNSIKEKGCIRSSWLKDYPKVFVGVVKLRKNVDDGVWMVKIRPPPRFYVNERELYDSNAEWIQSGVFSSLRCDVCGLPVFEGESSVVSRDDKECVICYKCMEVS